MPLHRPHRGEIDDRIVRWGEYTITVYQARTGKRVTTVHLRGRDTTRSNMIFVNAGGKVPVKTSGLTIDQVHQALDRYID